MISRTAFCSAQPATIREARHGADAGDLRQALRIGLDDLEGVLAKGGDDALGHGGPDAAHLA